MIVIECCPPFQWKPKFRRFGPRHWRIIWAWFGFAYTHYGLVEYVDRISRAAVDLERKKLKSATHVAVIRNGDLPEKKVVIMPPGQPLGFDPGPGTTRRWLWPYLGSSWHLVEFLEISRVPLAQHSQSAQRH